MVRGFAGGAFERVERVADYVWGLWQRGESDAQGLHVFDDQRVYVGSQYFDCHGFFVARFRDISNDSLTRNWREQYRALQISNSVISLTITVRLRRRRRWILQASANRCGGDGAERQRR